VRFWRSPCPARLAIVAVLLAHPAAGCIRHPPAPASPAAAPARIAAKVTIDPAERHQTLEGFGASVAWHLETITGNAPAGIYQLLFPELGLDILRFRDRYARSNPDDGDLRQEVEILRRGTAALGHPPKIMLSSWAPPAALKADGHEDCHDNRDCTLAKDNGRFVYDEFARYWADSLRHYAELGIVPDYITIENEPSFIPPTWEGCKFEPTETADYPGFDRALVAVSGAIGQLHLARPPKMLAPEVLGIHWGLLQKYLGPMNMNLVDGVAHHLYEKGPDQIWDWRFPGPDSFVDEMQAAAAATRKPLYQTEFQTDDDHGIEGGFETAWLIHLSLVEEGVVAFLYWNLVWNDHSGLVSINDGKVTIRDQYYAVKHYARFTDPGDVRVGARADARAIRASAFVAPSGDRLTIVVLNTGVAAADLQLAAGGFAFTRAVSYLTIFRPGASETWKDLGALDLARSIRLPGRSIATIVLTR
jgi:glucuronoarabinoxylan endo-1,4-beta-xylanase